MTFEQYKEHNWPRGEHKHIPVEDMVKEYIKYCDYNKQNKFKVDLDKGFQKPKITITGGTIVSGNSHTIGKLLTLCQENGIVLDIQQCNITWGEPAKPAPYIVPWTVVDIKKGWW